MIFKVHADVEVPRVPNFLLFTNGQQKISIADITDESLRGLAAEWTENLLARAAELRKQPRPNEIDEMDFVGIDR